jgi:hypothetical protein
VRALSEALDRDPNNWEYHFGLAVMRAAAGLDPRHQARVALRLNPLGPSPNDAVARFDTSSKASWKRRGNLLVERAFQ